MVRLCRFLLLLMAMLPAVAGATTPKSERDPDYVPKPEPYRLFDGLPQSGTAEGIERILAFDSGIVISADGSIEVSERIRVHSKGIDIRRGIMREIPTIYENGGRKVLVPLTILAVERDGYAEPYSEYPLQNGVGLRIGSADYFLEDGEHEYLIRYQVERQIGRFADWDELYWNVNGNSWEFRIDRVSCTVQLPGSPAPADIRSQAYTGYYGSQDTDYTVLQPAAGQVRFESSRPFESGEGLTIVVGFPKGLVAEPPVGQRFAWWFRSNGSWLVGLLLLAIVFGYYFSSWWRVGRDPREGLVLREERPLIGLSSPRLRFIWKLDADQTLMTALMLELAGQGHLKVRRKSNRHWTLLATERDRSALLPEERAFLETIFHDGGSSFSLDNGNAHYVKQATQKVREALSRELHHIYYEMNIRQRQAGIVLGCTVFVIYLILNMSGLYFFSTGDFFLFLLGMLALNITFYILLPAYSELGRAVLDRIEGFRLAMRGGEDSLGGYVHADEVLQERYLPYAVALDVNTEWVLKLRTALAQQGVRLQQPDWFSGKTRGYISQGEFDYTRFGNSMPRYLSQGYRRASTPPPPPPSSYSGGSSSGGSTSSGSWGSSSGSGFSSSSGHSGGGGGGGGGRGW